MLRIVELRKRETKEREIGRERGRKKIIKKEYLSEVVKKKKIEVLM